MTTLLVTMLSNLHLFADRGLSRLRREDGLEAVEYALIAALIAVAVTLTVTQLGTQVDLVFQNVRNTLTTALAN